MLGTRECGCGGTGIQMDVILLAAHPGDRNNWGGTADGRGAGSGTGECHNCGTRIAILGVVVDSAHRRLCNNGHLEAIVAGQARRVVDGRADRAAGRGARGTNCGSGGTRMAMGVGFACGHFRHRSGHSLGVCGDGREAGRGSRDCRNGGSRFEMGVVVDPGRRRRRICITTNARCPLRYCSLSNMGHN